MKQLKLIIPLHENVLLGPVCCHQRRAELNRKINYELIMTQHRLIYFSHEKDLPPGYGQKIILYQNIQDIQTFFKEQFKTHVLAIKRKDNSKIFLRLRSQDGELCQSIIQIFRNKPPQNPNLLSQLKAKLMLKNPQVGLSYRKYVQENKLFSDQQFWEQFTEVREFKRVRQSQLDMEMLRVKEQIQEEKVRQITVKEQQYVFQIPDELLFKPRQNYIFMNQTLPKTDTRIHQLNSQSVYRLTKDLLPVIPLQYMQIEPDIKVEPRLKPSLQNTVSQVPAERLCKKINFSLQVKPPAIPKEALQRSMRPQPKKKLPQESRLQLYQHLLMLVRLMYRLFEKNQRGDELYMQINGLAKELKSEEYDEDIRAIVSKCCSHYQNYLKKKYF